MQALDVIAQTNALLAELLITEPAVTVFTTVYRAGNMTASHRRNTGK